MSGFIDFLKNGFFHAAPILITAVFAIAIIAERTRALFQVYPVKSLDDFFEKVRELLLKGKTSDALALCEKHANKPAITVVKHAILRAHQPENMIEQGLQLSVGEAAEHIQKRTHFLATIANIVTLLGLFGTIAGLIHSFEAVGHADPQQKSALLAAGISQAMNATMLGLGVAIPCMLAYSFLINRTNQLLSQVDHSALRILDIIKQRSIQIEAEFLAQERFNDGVEMEQIQSVSQMNKERRVA